ncbi:ATP-binding protein [Candidatus Methylospira mobilis]|nr:ATP-binding protein [Candidatus Methylospira mobilis]WNV03269.1 ATP-binding protein [Candidatus Methylospira mobilis]
MTTNNTHGVAASPVTMTEEELQASAIRYRCLFPSIEDGILILNAQSGMIEDVNPALTALLGYSREALLEKFLWDIGSFRHVVSDRAGLLDLQSRKYICYDDVPLETADGAVMYVEFISHVYPDAEVQVIQCNIRSMTAHRRGAEQTEEAISQRTLELIRARDAAESANKAKSQFLANMSHELRTPLNAILGFSSMMRRDPLITESQRENLNIINSSGAHLLSLINEVLDMAKIDVGGLQLETAPFDLGGMLRDVTEMMQLRAHEKGLQLLLYQTSVFPRYIQGYEERLRQVLVKLVDNALKFTERGGVTIRFGVKQNARQHMVIEIEDSGVGIGTEDRKRLFEPFVHMAEGGGQQGAGLSLAISRQLIELMGGSIVVESTPEKGSLFRIELPMELAKAEDVFKSENQGEVEGLAPGQPSYRILIAEDRRDNRLLLSRLMTNIGLDVKVAENGEQCVELFQSWHPDLIWMDRRMPVLDGVETTRCIRRLPEGRAVKIVAVTASVTSEQHQEMLAAGVDDCVSKPYRFKQIYDSLARQLGITYRYAEAGEAAGAALKPAMLARLPSGLRIELRDALIRLDSDRIAAAIRQISDIDADLGRTLSGLTENFDYPAILNVLRERGSEN